MPIEVHLKETTFNSSKSTIESNLVHIDTMPNTYRIIIRNKADKFQRFLLFNEAPHAATKTSAAKAYTNVWGEAPGVPGPHGKTDFKITVAEWAVCGVAPQNLNERVVVETSDAAPVDMNAGSTTGTKVFMVVKEGGAGFDPSKISTTDAKGAFAIQTDSYDGPANRKPLPALTLFTYQVAKTINTY